MLEVEYRKRFDKSFWELPEDVRDLMTDAIGEFFKTVEEKKPARKGLGLKKYHDDYWEIRTELGTRILFEWVGSKVSFALFGSHDDLKKFIKNR